MPLEGFTAKEAVKYTERFYNPATRDFDYFDPTTSEYTVSMFIADFKPLDRFDLNPFESDKHRFVQIYFHMAAVKLAQALAKFKVMVNPIDGISSATLVTLFSFKQF